MDKYATTDLVDDYLGTYLEDSKNSDTQVNHNLFFKV
jgi:hypothetical protein